MKKIFKIVPLVKKSLLRLS